MTKIKRLILINKLLHNAKTEKLRHFLLSKACEVRNATEY